MLNDGFFELSDITKENISALSTEQSVSFEKRICEISELCDTIVELFLNLSQDGLGIYEILGFLSDRINFGAEKAHSISLDENKERISRYLSTLSFYDKAVFSQLLTEKIKDRRINLSELDFLPTGSGDSKIVYVKNRLADEAYDVFSDILADATVSYTDSLKNAAKSVADGVNEYCLLPLEEKGGARLAVVASLLYAYDLKIAMVTPVFGFDGTADVKYALVASHFNIPKSESDDDRYLEIRIKADFGLSLSGILCASELLGATVYRINTVRFNTDEGEESYFTVVFREEGEDFTPLLLFLTLFVGAYSAVGIYKNLE